MDPTEKTRISRLEHEIWDLCRRTECVFYSYSIPVEEIEDLVQEVFVVAYKDIHKLEKEEYLSAWIRGIARNKARKYWETEARKGKIWSLDSEEGMAAFEAVRYSGARTGRHSICETLAREETLRELFIAMSAFREKELEIVLLRDLEGYSLKEISEKQGIKYATVRTVYSRTKKKLRDLFEERSED